MKGGNGVARKSWLATWTPEDCMIPGAGDEKRIKAFIRQCFVRGQWSENKIPASEPLENLVGKDAVQNLRIGKTATFTGLEPTFMGKQPWAYPTEQTKPQTFTEPFEVQTNQSSEWDPFGSTSAHSVTPTPEPTAPKSTTPANPFSSFSTAPAQQPTPQQPTPQPNNKPPSNPLPPQQRPVDVHSLFVSTPVTTQPTAPVTVQPGYVPMTYPYVVNPNFPGVPQPYLTTYAWPQSPVITVQTQPPAVQTGPDAFSGLLAGFGAKPTTPW